MAQVKVKFNPEIPDKEVIARHKDFGKFMQGYQKYYTTRGIRYMLKYERKKLVFIVILIIVLLLMLFAD